jgi:hypothetical protein
MLCLSLSICGCASTSAPRGWLESPYDMQSDAHGGWLRLETKTELRMFGELIAISSDSLFLAGEDLQAVAQADIKSARLLAYKSNAEEVGGLVALGTLATLSNGVLLLFTAPMWMIGGGIVTGVRSFQPTIDYPKQEWSRFRAFSRFPQGLPPGLDRSQIRMKPEA